MNMKSGGVNKETMEEYVTQLTSFKRQHIDDIKVRLNTASSVSLLNHLHIMCNGVVVEDLPFLDFVVPPD